LKIELLEDRYVPATIVVTSLADVALGAAHTGVTLRDAIQAANTNQSVNGSTAGSPGADTITFAPALIASCTPTNSCRISLGSTLGQLPSITEPLTIQAPGSASVTIDAQGHSRIFDIAAMPPTAGDVTLDGLTLTGGKTTGSAPSNDFTYFGGAIRSLSGGMLTLRNCTLTGNAVQGANSGGGAVFTGAGALTLDHSTLQGNSAAFRGGAIYAGSGAVTLTDSIVSGNFTQGGIANGGGIFVDTAPLTVQDSTVSGNHTTLNGARGGGIFVRGPANNPNGTSPTPLDVKVTGSTVTGNYTQGDHASGGGIYVLRNTTLTITGSTVSGNYTKGTDAPGGGLTVQSGTLALTESTVSGNHTQDFRSPGGGLAVQSGTLTATGSTISGNHTYGEGTGGSGIFAHAEATLTNSTISGNTSRDGSGAGIYATGNLTLNNSTVSGNTTGAIAVGAGGGGISFQNGTLTLLSSIVAGNSAAVAINNRHVPDVNNYLGFPVNASYSLVGDATGSGLTPTNGLTPDGTGNLIGSDTAPIDPMLGQLADNGGPTQTMALSPLSPAVDHGANPHGLTTDQRGLPFVRVSGAKADMGAFEVQPRVALVVTSAADRLDPTFDPSNLTLRDAVALADVNRGGGDTITFASNLSGVPIRLSQGQLPITEGVTIQGLGAAATCAASNTCIDAQGQSRIFDVSESAGAVTLDGLTLTGGQAAVEGGGAVRLEAGVDLTIQNSTLSGNSSQGPGGAIAAPYGRVFVKYSTLADNSTTGPSARGGALFARGLASVTNSTVARNSTHGAGASGGGIFAAAEADVIDSTLSGNFTTGASANGGGIATAINLYGPSGGAFVENSTVAGNSTQGPGSVGGGVASVKFVTVRSSIVAGNHDSGSNPDLKGGIGSPIVTNSLIGNNTGTGLAATGSGQTPGTNGNFIGSAASPVDPMLGLLANNGGPTQTMALMSGSPAIDHGANPLGLASDQRGGLFARVYGPQADMGAFEVQPPPRLIRWPPPTFPLGALSATRQFAPLFRVAASAPASTPLPPPAASAQDQPTAAAAQLVAPPVRIVLRLRRVDRRRRLVAVVASPQGLPPRVLASPFQRPWYRSVVAAVADLDGDGIADAVVFTARAGRRKVTAVVRL
jgi:CSLREA domain-containing protein